eukprot:TRINITY_DN16947_c0_g1_i3.p1 TRINITY_DN16947_c0_g1~~TRINITY_DN16947_c0_g1_i3.p1  ORF type:complete len:699 (-),score=194.23 TRINITY_DN16947_c0_g1_i3:207-2303(-)
MLTLILMLLPVRVSCFQYLCITFLFFFFFFKQKTAYEMLRSLVGSEMCIRDRFVTGAQTIFCTTMEHDHLVQVTEDAVLLIGGGPAWSERVRWATPEGTKVQHAVANQSTVLVATSGGHLHLLQVGQGTLSQVATRQMPHEISAICISEGHCVVSTWVDIKVEVLSLPALDTVVTEQIPGHVIVRSVQLCSLDKGESVNLFAALGDGHLYIYTFQDQTLSNRRKVALASKPISLSRFESNGATNLFAASDRPCVVYSSNNKIMYSNVDLHEATCMGSFHSEAFPNSLVISSESDLTIGTIDQINKLHIRSFPLGEQPRRLCYHDSAGLVGVCTLQTAAVPETSSFKLFDDLNFEQLASFDMHSDHAAGSYEAAISCIAMRFDSEPETEYFVVGTALHHPDEVEPKEGRILVFSVHNKTPVLVAELQVQGAVHDLCALGCGRLVAGINSRVCTFSWGATAISHKLQQESSHSGHILALYVKARGELVLVGDLMKSMTLLSYKQDENGEGKLVTVATDCNANWMTAMEMWGDSAFLGAEGEWNLFALAKKEGAATPEESQRLETVAEFHLGQFVNKFREGSLVLKVPDSTAACTYPSMIFGTVQGSIGLVVQLPESVFCTLSKVQSNLTRMIKGVGGLKHSQWRAFTSETRTHDARGFIDGDLVEQMLDLPAEMVQEAANGTNSTPEELLFLVDELSRLH